MLKLKSLKDTGSGSRGISLHIVLKLLYIIPLKKSK